MTAYPWYCPDCGKEEFGAEEADEPKVCSSCGAEMCRLDVEEDKDSDSGDDA